MLYFNQMLSITQCDNQKTVIPEKFRSVDLDLMFHHERSFPFPVISSSVYQMFLHSFELFEMTQGKPIAAYAGKFGEAWNNYITFKVRTSISCKAMLS